MNIHRHILYIIRTFFLDITLLTKSYGRRLIGRHEGVSKVQNYPLYKSNSQLE